MVRARIEQRRESTEYEQLGPYKDSIPQMVFDSVGPVRFRDARADFYKSEPSTNNSLRGSGAMGDLGTYTLGASYLNQRGVNPAEQLGRLNLNANINMRLSKWLQSTTSIQKIRSNNPYSDDSFSGIDHTLINMPATFDVRQGYMPDGTPVFLTSGTNGQPSLQWQTANEFNTELTNRWVASQQFSLTLAPGVHLNNNAGLDTYVSEFGRFVNQRPWLAAIGTASGSTQQRKSTRTTINNDMTFVVDPRPLMHTGVTVSGLLGGNLYSQEAASLTGNGSSIVLPNYYNLGNFATQTVSATLTTQRRLLGAYSQIEADYGDWAFLTFTGRNDWSSTLPTNANSYFYPSASLAIVFTDALNWHPRWLDYGKIRISSAKVGNDAPIYALTTRYVSASAAGADNSQQQNGARRSRSRSAASPRTSAAPHSATRRSSRKRRSRTRSGWTCDSSAIARGSKRRRTGSRATTRFSPCHPRRPRDSRASPAMRAICATKASNYPSAAAPSIRACSPGTLASTGRRTGARS